MTAERLRLIEIDVLDSKDTVKTAIEKSVLRNVELWPLRMGDSQTGGYIDIAWRAE